MNIDEDSVPSNVEEAIKMFLNALDNEELKAFIEIDEKDLALFHFTFGQEIRNAWSLWEEDTKLVKDFNTLGIQHPDDMSTIIMVSAYRALNNKPIRMKQQIKFYKNYWQKQVNKL